MTTPHGGGTRTAASAASNTYAPRPSWNRRLHGVPGAAKLLGIECDGRSLGWCPACGVVTEPVRGRLPRGGANRVSVTPSGLGWCCHGCHVGGSAADLISWRRFRRPVAELSRDELRALGEHVDALTGDAPAAPPRSAPAYVQLTAAERAARAKEADDRRWRNTLDEAALYVRELLARTGARSEREAWNELERFEPPPTAYETSAIVWRGERITWGSLHVAWLSSLHEMHERYFDDG